MENNRKNILLIVLAFLLIVLAAVVAIPLTFLYLPGYLNQNFPSGEDRKFSRLCLELNNKKFEPESFKDMNKYYIYWLAYKYKDEKGNFFEAIGGTERFLPEVHIIEFLDQKDVKDGTKFYNIGFNGRSRGTKNELILSRSSKFEAVWKCYIEYNQEVNSITSFSKYYPED